MLGRSAVVAATLFIASCATTPSVIPMKETFNPSEFAWSTAKGNSTIVGQAFIKTRSGDVKLAAGNIVRLVPVNAYTTELRVRRTINGEKVGAVDPRLEQYNRTTVADAGGNFEFKELPAGSWYVSCAITWEAANQGDMQQAGGIAYGTATVAKGETKKVVVTRN